MSKNPFGNVLGLDGVNYLLIVFHQALVFPYKSLDKCLIFSSMNIEQRLVFLFERHMTYFTGSVSGSYSLSVAQIRKYGHKLLWQQSTDIGFFGCGLSSNHSLDWSEELLNEFSERWDWSSISNYIIGKDLWTDTILDKYKDKIDWIGISWNHDIPWTAALIEKYQDKIDWKWFSRNRSSFIKWDAAFLSKYEHKIDFDAMSNNDALPWTGELSFTLKELSPEMNLHDRLDLIEKYEEKLNWDSLFFDWKNGLDRKICDKIIDQLLS